MTLEEIRNEVITAIRNEMIGENYGAFDFAIFRDYHYLDHKMVGRIFKSHYHKEKLIFELNEFDLKFKPDWACVLIVKRKKKL